MAGAPGGAVLLLGAPGVGKTTLGRYLQQQHPASTRFLSVGDELRSSGLLQRYLERPSAAGREELRQAAKELLRRECRQWIKISPSSSSSCCGPVLLLECVRELADAFDVMEVLREEGVPLLQVLYLPRHIIDVPPLAKMLSTVTNKNNNNKEGSEIPTAPPPTHFSLTTAAATAAASSAPWLKERTLAERQAEWAANAGALLEFFSALGCMSELLHSAADRVSLFSGDTQPCLAKLGYAAGPAFRHQPFSQPPGVGKKKGKKNRKKKKNKGREDDGFFDFPDTLEGLREAVRKAEAGEAGKQKSASKPSAGDASGAAAAASSNTTAAAAAAAAAGPTSAETDAPDWLRATRWRLPFQLTLTPLQPVTSRRLVTSAAERDRVLAEAKRVSGLSIFGGVGGRADGGEGGGQRGPLLPVPSAAVSSADDVGWVCWPGRYAVSRKCDGTRHLLLVVEGQQQQQQMAGQSEGAIVAGVSSAANSAGPSGAPASEAGPRSEQGVYLLNRAGALYAFPIVRGGADGSPGGSGSSSPAAPLPPGTVLDGELVWVGGRGFFLAFDALVVGGRRVWQLPLRGRLEALEGPPLELAEAERDTQLAAAAAVAAAAAATTTSTPPRSDGMDVSPPPPAASSAFQALHKKQQAPPPGDDTLVLLRKRHVDVSSAALKALAASQAACPYPADGLVFTPYDMPYVLGMSELLYKWQPEGSLCVDMQGKDMTSVLFVGLGAALTTPRNLLQDLIFQCRAGGKELVPVAVRWDLAAGTSKQEALIVIEDARAREVASLELLVVAAQEFEARHRRLATALAAGGAPLVAAAVPAAEAAEAAAADAAAGISSARPDVCGGGGGGGGGWNWEWDGEPLAGWRPPHPARMVPYDQLYGRLLAEVAAGRVERTVDAATGLEVFEGRPAASQLGSLAALCRGLVLHPPSRAVVATPLARFGEVQLPAAAKAPWAVAVPEATKFTTSGKPSWCRTQPQLVATLLPDEVAARSEAAWQWEGQGPPPDLAAASLKVDGCLVLAFRCGDQLRAASGSGGFESVQAQWAAQWLRDHSHTAAFQPGWTYLLEAVYDLNTVVVPYAFEGLVLLAAVDPRGCELPARQLPALAAELGVTCAAPYITGLRQELVDRLQVGLHAREPSATSSTAAAPTPVPASEGWVIMTADGLRQTLVQMSYRRAVLATRLLHPLAVWDLVRCGGARRETLAAGLPAHLRSELAAQLGALEEGFLRARGLLLRLLREARQRQLSGELRELLARWAREGGLAGEGARTPIGDGGGADAAVRPVADEGMEAVEATAGQPAAGSSSGGRGDTGLRLQRLLAGLLRDDQQEAAGGSGSGVAGPGGAEEQAGSGEAPTALLSSTAFLRALSYAVEHALSTSPGTGVSSSSSGTTSGTGAGGPEGLAGAGAVAAAAAVAASDGGGGDAGGSGGGGGGAGGGGRCAVVVEWNLNESSLAPSMYYSPDSRPTMSHRAPSLRGLLLDCVRPGDGGSLPGYQPSPNAAQTYAKSWPRGPTAGRMAPPLLPPPLLPSGLSDELLGSCLLTLEGRDLVAAMLVCSRWRRVLRDAGAAGRLKEKLEAGRCAVDERRMEKWRKERDYAYDYDDDDYDSYYGEDYYGYHDYDDDYDYDYGY